MSRILVVDDDGELQANMVEILEGEGFVVDAANNGAEALEQLERGSFDLVLLDVVMPVMGGKEALPQIKWRFPKVRVIMMTAFSTVDSAVDAMRNGADDYLTKPFKIDEFLTTIRRILEEARFIASGEALNVDSVLKSLANATRRSIMLLLLDEGQMRFMDIARHLEIEDHTKVNFHLKVLKDADLLEQDDKKTYRLSTAGKTAIDFLNAIRSI